MVSGIGPREQLEAHNITVIADRAGVGEYWMAWITWPSFQCANVCMTGANMQDHLDFAPVFEITIRNDVGATSDPTINGPLIKEYRVNRTGPFTNAGVDYIGWEKLPEPYRSNLSARALADLAKFPADWPEVRRAPSDLETCPCQSEKQC